MIGKQTPEQKWREQSATLMRNRHGCTATSPRAGFTACPEPAT